MTNIGSIAGSIVWMAIASLLMMATLEPVQQQGGAAAWQIASVDPQTGIRSL